MKKVEWGDGALLTPRPRTANLRRGQVCGLVAPLPGYRGAEAHQHRALPGPAKGGRARADWAEPRHHSDVAPGPTPPRPLEAVARPIYQRHL